MLYSLRSELLVTKMDVSTTKIHLDTFISWTSNSERREYVSKTGRHVIIKGIMCKVSRCNLTKLEAIQARHHMQHATIFDSAKLKQAPGMVVCGN